MRYLLAAALVGLTACGGGGSSQNPLVPTPVEVPPVVIVEPIEPPVDVPTVPEEPVQMSAPPACPTTATATGDPVRPYITCDGIPITDAVDYPVDHNDNYEIAIIEILAIWDQNMTTAEMDGLDPIAFVQRELDHANKVFADSFVYIELHLAGLDAVDVAEGDLYRHYKHFTQGTKEFSDVERWQREQGADYAFLFKRRPDDAWACGVAVLDAARLTAEKRRGITHCYQGDTFNSTSTTRYYERAGETFVHEIGHLLGLEHNIESATYDPAFTFSYGYLLPEFQLDLSDEFNGYGTIMSYSDKGTGRFSDPSAYFMIPETGEMVLLGAGGTASAVRHLNRVRYYMSQLHEMDTKE